jgi:hypothetical protein
MLNFRAPWYMLYIEIFWKMSICPKIVIKHVRVVFQNKHIFENLRLVFDFFFLHFGLRETESGFEKHILYTRNYYKLGDSYTVVKDLFLVSPLITVSWFLSLF